MRQRPSGLKKPVYLSDSMHKRLNTYALAATAAGVSLLACPPRAEATVVFTNTWIPITPTTATTNIDLNGDGVVDFVVSDFGKFCNSNTSRCVEETMKVLPQGSGNAVWGASTYASALSSGVGVGSQGKFQAGHELMANEEHFESSQTTGYRSRGPWLQATNRYLGVKFIIQGEVHFGWVRMDGAAAINGIYAAISGYAYETVPNKPILTGQKSGAQEQRKNGKRGSVSLDVPASAKGGLGVLAVGALGLQSSKGWDVFRK